MKTRKGIFVTAMGAMMILSSMVLLFEADYSTPIAGTTSSNEESSYSYAQASSYATGLPPLTASVLKQELRDLNIPDRYAYLPNLGSPYLANETVQALYDRSPAPMGVSDWGYMEPSSLKLPYTYTTTSFQGSVMFEELKPMYPMNSDPGSVAVQLNAVLDGVSLNGHGSYTFWIKNIMYYTPSSGEVFLIDNVWNLSSPSMSLPSNSILSGSGNVASDIFYFNVGPEMKLNGDSAITLYVTTGVVDGNTAVIFDYSVGQPEMNQTTPRTTFDTVVFNSKGTGSSPASGNAVFKVDGFKKTPSGLLYDVELVLGGPGGGSMTTIYDANGQLKLKFLGSDGTYTKLPAAYNYGSNAAETAQGISCWWSSQMKPMIHLSAGPSLLIPMWGSQISHSGGTNIQGIVAPANAFVFLSTGTSVDNSTAAWAPLNENGSYKFAMPGQMSYSGVVMLTGYQPQYFNIISTIENETEEGQGGHAGRGGGSENETTTWINITLVPNPGGAAYTPLYANGNDQLKYLTVEPTGNMTYGGNGTPDNPYLISKHTVVSVDPLFSVGNSYMYPSFSGVLIMNTTASVVVDNPPEFQVHYTGTILGAAKSMGLPPSNELNYVFYNTSGVTFTGDRDAGGWFASSLTPGTVASVQFMESSDFLIASNTFYGMGSSLLLYNSPNTSGNGVIWNNHFLESPLMRNSPPENIMFSAEPVGINLFSSGNLVYNNYFAVHNPVNTRTSDPYSGEQSAYTNTWNLSEKKAPDYAWMYHGMRLTGTVVDSGYQGGNFWISHNDPSPVSVSSIILSDIDYEPLVVQGYNVTFTNIGLPAGENWSVYFNGETRASNSSEITFQAVDGLYGYEISKPADYYASPASGEIAVYGADIRQEIHFSPVVYSVNFVESGLLAGMTWEVTVGETTLQADGNTLSLMVQNGSYGYTVSMPDGYTPDIVSGTVYIYGSSVSVDFNVTRTIYSVTFMALGLPTGTTWAVNFDGGEFNSTSSSLTLQVTGGNHTFSIAGVDGYSMESANGYVVVNNGNETVNLQFHEEPKYGGMVLLIGVGALVGVGATVGAIYLLRKK